jgi:large subunit ribosomal protein L29
MTIKEIREKNDEQLRNELTERQKHLFDLRSQAVTEKLEDPSQLSKTRKDIARIMTVLRQREIDGQTSATPTEAEAPGKEAARPAKRRTPKRPSAAKRKAATRKAAKRPAAKRPAAKRTAAKRPAATRTAKRAAGKRQKAPA